MADNLFFSRDTKVVIGDGTSYWELPVLDGYSFSQATNTSEITLNEMETAAGVSRRGRRMFNDSFAPAEWSFSTYMRPYQSSGTKEGSDGNSDGASAQVHAVEEALWAALVGSQTYTAGTNSANSDFSGSNGVQLAASTMEIDFAGSNSSNLGELQIWFLMGQGTAANGTHLAYKLDGAVVNSATINFEIDGIATIEWSGFAKLITEETATSFPTATVTDGAGSTSNFIRNRLTSLSMSSSVGAHALTLTGGSISFENNITFLTPETLGVINTPLGAVAGTRNISGNFTCYLSNTDNAGAELYATLVEDTTNITNSHKLTFSVGGSTNPKVGIELPTCHLEIPTHSIEDIISLDVNFHALPSTVGGADEATITYSAG